jgi:ADP-ribose pyrophosphatase
MTGFRKLSEEERCRGWRFVVTSARYEAPDGTEFERDVVHHPGAVAVVPLHDDGSVTLVRQFRAALDAHLVELPAGIRDVHGEDDVTTASRELVEEAGLAASQVEPLVSFHNSPGFCDEVVAIFLATGLAAVPDNRQGVEEEAMTILRVPLDEALAWIDDGRITDAKTIIGLTLTAHRRP